MASTREKVWEIVERDYPDGLPFGALTIIGNEIGVSREWVRQVLLERDVTVQANATRQCDLDWCERPVEAKGLCGLHYSRRKGGRPDVIPSSDDPLHGHTTGTAYNVGCRCGVCRKTHNERLTTLRRKRYESTAKEGLPEGVPHNRSAYVNWGCRCDICTAAHSAYHLPYQQAYHARKKAAKQEEN